MLVPHIVSWLRGSAQERRRPPQDVRGWGCSRWSARFGERTFFAASYTEKRGSEVYRVTETLDTRRYSTAFGNWVVELSLFEIANDQIVRTSRRTYAGIRARETGTSAEAGTLMAEATVEALGAVIDTLRVTMHGARPPVPPAIVPVVPTIPGLPPLPP